MDSIRYLTMPNWRRLRWCWRLTMLSHWHWYIQHPDIGCFLHFHAHTLTHTQSMSRKLRTHSKQNENDYIMKYARNSGILFFNWLFATSRNDERFIWPHVNSDSRFFGFFCSGSARQPPINTPKTKLNRKSNWIVNFVCHSLLTTNNST